MFKISATVLVLVFSCTSCSDDPIRINQPGTLSANQNGKTWVGTNSHALIVNENFLISSKSDDGSEISISLNNNVVALYQVDGYDSQYTFNNIVSYISGGSATPVFSSINLTGNEVGRVIIEEINTTDGTISGTFYSKVRRTTPSDSTILFEN